MKDQADFITVAVPLPLHTLFTYSVPEHLAARTAVGKRVLVPFGRRRITGYDCGPGRPDETYTVKPILDVLDEDPLFPESMLPYFQWIADYYMHPLGEVIQTALPGGLSPAEFTLYQLSEAGRKALEQQVGGELICSVW